MCFCVSDGHFYYESDPILLGQLHKYENTELDFFFGGSFDNTHIRITKG